ncbi:MAG: hypothetical protein O2960_20365 [Verrucomicrobia bacterium]|nr:hypothetical protein [Verrucomicrobiota bacterium]
MRCPYCQYQEPTPFQRLGWTESDLIGQPKRAAGKLAIAARLRRETTMLLNRIAARVRLGTSKGANSSLHRWMKANPKPNAEAIIGAGGTNTASITNQSMG